MKIVNDYELIYLIKDYQCEIAFDCLCKKYQRLIYKMAHKFCPHHNELEDYFQEGISALFNCVRLFSTEFNKTFTRYFELVLYRRLIRVRLNQPKYTLFEDVLLLEDKSSIYTPLEFEYLTDFNKLEQIIHDMYFIHRNAIKTIAQANNLTVKQVYNIIYKIKRKYKK
jgi:RNA polymerase sporulation-specific sigma factor